MWAANPGNGVSAFTAQRAPVAGTIFDFWPQPQIFTTLESAERMESVVVK